MVSTGNFYVGVMGYDTVEYCSKLNPFNIVISKTLPLLCSVKHDATYLRHINKKEVLSLNFQTNRKYEICHVFWNLVTLQMFLLSQNFRVSSTDQSCHIFETIHNICNFW
jgi:hypothetical protein